VAEVRRRLQPAHEALDICSRAHTSLPVIGVEARMLDVGDVLADFEMPLHDGSVFRLADQAGKPGVIFFYPKADTPACTQEAIDFTAAAAAFAAKGAWVIGVSRDPVKANAKFASKHTLGIPLGSDGEGGISDTLGVWGEKSMYGKKYMGLDRSTFLIGPDRKIAAVWRKVKVPGHVSAVLAELDRLV
jgi:peroxiredoxin Q/BCP